MKPVAVPLLADIKPTADPRSGHPSGALNFGRFEIHPALRQVWVDGAIVPMGSRAFDLLMLLLEQRHRILSRDEIIDHVWRGLVIEDSNLSVQISTLRRALGADVITTVTGHGYRFTAPPGSDAMGLGAVVLGNLPAREAALIGRDEDLTQLLQAHAEAACVTVCGPAGIGKTALATLAVQRLAGTRAHAQGAWRVELGDVREKGRVVQAVCDALGLELAGRREPLHECLAHLQHRELLLMLDNCEHVIDEVATLMNGLLAAAGGVRVITTSQEPLRVAGERVLRLQPLAVPVSPHADDAAGYGAVRLLIERVRGAMGSRYEPSVPELVDLVEICRQLDGIPLALEFAATRVPLLGTTGVRSRLGDRLRLLSSNSRSAPPRHRSLQAALEWSHHLLSPRTQSVLHRLSVFPGGFSLLGARLLLDVDQESDVVEALEVLVDRSLLVPQPGMRPRYRMLETTRAFALECLHAEGEAVHWAERQARTMAKLCVLVAQDRDTSLMWQEMVNARAALAWALAAPGHGETAVTIATYISVVLGAGGAIREALEHLQRVRQHVTVDCPAPLAARYWHWLGRLGVEGRLPTSLCVDALERADDMFAALGEPRHRQGCQRHLAEAALRSGNLDRAEQHLQEVRRLEKQFASPADRLRRLRVEALLADARHDHAAALRHAQAALTLAEAQQVERYRLLLMADMGWIHLQIGHADAAVTSFQELLVHLDRSPRQGLARARAMAGLTAALLADTRVDDAVHSAWRSVPALHQANLLRGHCDVLAWVTAAAGDPRTAALLLGAGDDFVARTQTERDPVSSLARERASALVREALAEEDRHYFAAQGGTCSDADLHPLLLQAFAAIAAAAESTRRPS